MWIAAWTVFVLCVLRGEAADPELEEEELRARAFLQHLNQVYLHSGNRIAVAEWNYQTNITDGSRKELVAEQAKAAEAMKRQWEEVVKFDWHRFSDNEVKRQFRMLSVLGPAILPEAKFKKSNQLISQMQETYSTAKICDIENDTKCDLVLNPDLENIMATSNDTDVLKHTWIEWRNTIGPRIKHTYKEYVELQNEAAQLNNFTDAGQYWLNDYDTPDIKQQIEQLWEQLKPLYMQIHAYVRFNLRKKYGDLVTEKGPIPAHLLGNMWAQSWDYLFEDSKPYPDKMADSVSDEMVKQNWDHLKIFKTAEDFFVSLNLSAMPKAFWKDSLFKKPKDREVVCHASALDFYNGEDFRIKQCTIVNEENLLIAHHEMGHIQYFLQYKHQPAVYRTGANEGFHEAIGDVIALSVRTNKHLRKLGLVTAEDDPENELNNLYNIGLSKIAFLPFSYIMDLWRWDVFSGKTTFHEYNCKWWKLVEDYQGIEPPVDRTEKDFDPAAKYHIVADVPYLRYFVSYVIQFQFHRALCIKAGEYDPHDPTKPLHNCDIYNSTEAGKVLGQMLRMGKSRPWQDAMEVVTGQRNMDASGLIEYFRPLQIWLEGENKKNGVTIGWEPSKKVCVKSRKDLVHTNEN